MREQTERLRTTLSELHQELAAGALDSSSRALLQEALQDILDALASAPPDAGAKDASVPLVERLRDASRRVEAEHPELAAVVERLLDTVASLGI